MSSSGKIYLDSCCFIELVKFRRCIPLSAEDELQKDRENECWYLKRLCDAARDGALQMVTSMLTVAECTYVKGEDNSPSPETRALFVDFLTSGQVARLVEPDIFVAEQARDLLWTHDIKLKGADALHVATALIEGAKEFVTWDDRIKKQLMSDAIPKLKRLGLQVTRASETGLLPPEYRQGTIDDRAG